MLIDKEAELIAVVAGIGRRLHGGIDLVANGFSDGLRFVEAAVITAGIEGRTDVEHRLAGFEADIGSGGIDEGGRGRELLLGWRLDAGRNLGGVETRDLAGTGGPGSLALLRETGYGGERSRDKEQKRKMAGT